MNTIGISLYVISIIIWWAGFNYAATRTESPTRRKLLSTAAAFALAWPAAFIALAGALATKAAANLMITVGNGINSTWDAAVSDEGDTIIVTKLAPMGTAMRVRRGNAEHDTSAANSDYEDSDTNAASSEETSPALADNMPLMPPPPPPTANEADGDETAQSDAGDNAADTTDNAESDNVSDVDETVNIQKVSLADIL
jgi:hypothetical protein